MIDMTEGKQTMVWDLCKLSLNKEKLYFIGTAFAEGVWNYRYYPGKVIENSAELLKDKPIHINHMSKSAPVGKVIKVIKRPNRINVLGEISDPAAIDLILNKGFTGLSPQVASVWDEMTGIVEGILAYVELSITSNPACKLCWIDKTETEVMKNMTDGDKTLEKFTLEETDTGKVLTIDASGLTGILLTHNEKKKEIQDVDMEKMTGLETELEALKEEIKKVKAENTELTGENKVLSDTLKKIEEGKRKQKLTEIEDLSKTLEIEFGVEKYSQMNDDGLELVSGNLKSAIAKLTSDKLKFQGGDESGDTSDKEVEDRGLSGE